MVPFQHDMMRENSEMCSREVPFGKSNPDLYIHRRLHLYCCSITSIFHTSSLLHCRPFQKLRSKLRYPTRKSSKKTNSTSRSISFTRKNVWKSTFLLWTLERERDWTVFLLWSEYLKMKLETEAPGEEWRNQLKVLYLQEGKSKWAWMNKQPSGISKCKVPRSVDY
jgi:hypothetical protein